MTSTEVQHCPVKNLKMVLTSLCLLFSFISAEVFAQSKAARVIILRGTAQVTTKDGTTTKLKRGDWLPEGSIVKTEAKSFVKLLFIDKSSLNIAPKSSITIAKFSKKKAGIINLLQGKIRSKVVKDYMNKGEKGKKSKLFIKTKTAAMGVRGTDFTVGTGVVDTVTVVEGTVTVAQTTSTSFNPSTLDNILNTKGVPVPQGTAAKIPKTSAKPITKQVI
ncbi:FecR family protein, partial [Bacteriovoracales bacterium]|nr:FecR family protein [Bacteriovoracales bacterium]